jgi:hypothetical protein
MKYLFLFLIGASLFSCTSTDKPATKEQATRDSLNRVAMADSANYTTIEWLDSTNQDLGKIKEGSVVELTWKFKNTGNKALIINHVQPACGCTIAEKPNEPIAPGEQGVIKARFNSSGQSEVVEKSMSVSANTRGTTEHKLTFHAQISKS